MSTHIEDRRVEMARSYITGLRQCLELLAVDQIATMMTFLEQAYHDGRQIFIMGNGGSAATASHMACDLAKNIMPAASRDTARRFRVTALTDNVAWITALGNDIGYEHIFSEQLKNLAGPGDLVIVISGSGNSANIIHGVRAARQIGARVVGLLGFDGGAVRDLLDGYVLVDSRDYGHIEDIHMALDHLLTAYFRLISHEQWAPENLLELGNSREVGAAVQRA